MTSLTGWSVQNLLNRPLSCVLLGRLIPHPIKKDKPACEQHPFFKNSLRLSDILDTGNAADGFQLFAQSTAEPEFVG